MEKYLLHPGDYFSLAIVESETGERQRKEADERMLMGGKGKSGENRKTLSALPKGYDKTFELRFLF